MARVPNWYLTLSIFYSLFAIFFAILFVGVELSPGIKITELSLYYIWLITNIVMFIIFLKKKIEAAGLWLTGLQIVDRGVSAVIAFIAGIAFGISAIVKNPDVTEIPIPELPVILITILIPSIVIVFSIALLFRK